MLEYSKAWGELPLATVLQNYSVVGNSHCSFDKQDRMSNRMSHNRKSYTTSTVLDQQVAKVFCSYDFVRVAIPPSLPLTLPSACSLLVQHSLLVRDEGGRPKCQLLLVELHRSPNMQKHGSIERAPPIHFRYIIMCTYYVIVMEHSGDSLQIPVGGSTKSSPSMCLGYFLVE